MATGCGISPAEKVVREQALKAASDQFVQRVVQEDWSGVYGMTQAGFGDPEELKENLKKAWPADAVLTGGTVSSMAWMTGSVAKVKISWSFQSGMVQSYSGETFAWEWLKKEWKLKGRVLR